MNWTIYLASLLIILPSSLYAQKKKTKDTLTKKQPVAPPVVITPPYGNLDTINYKYTQARYYVKSILPFLKDEVDLFNSINTHMHDPSISAHDRKIFMHDTEPLFKARFEDQMKSMSEVEAIILVKVIARQTGLNIYEQIVDFKGKMAALKWQTWARLHSFQMNTFYHPDDEAQLEQIMIRFGYTLPQFYELRQKLEHDK